jgi:hypothetical protein
MFYTSKTTALQTQGNTRFCISNQMNYKQSHINENKQTVLEFSALKYNTINYVRTEKVVLKICHRLKFGLHLLFAGCTF